MHLHTGNTGNLLWPAQWRGGLRRPMRDCFQSAAGGNAAGVTGRTLTDWPRQLQDTYISVGTPNPPGLYSGSTNWANLGLILRLKPDERRKRGLLNQETGDLKSVQRKLYEWRCGLGGTVTGGRWRISCSTIQCFQFNSICIAAITMEVVCRCFTQTQSMTPVLPCSILFFSVNVCSQFPELRTNLQFQPIGCTL